MSIQTEIRGKVQKIIKSEKRTEIIIDKIPVKFWGDTLTHCDKLKEGDWVKISIIIEGSEWKGKFYPNVNAYSSWTGKSSIRDHIPKEDL